MLRGTPNRAHRTMAAATVLAMVAATVGVASLTSVAAPASAAPNQSCSFANAGTGTYASTLCWFDLSSYDAQQAGTAGGQQMAFTLPGGDTLSYTLKVSGGAVHPTGFPTYQQAYLGNAGFYSGVMGKPALYQTGEGTTTTATLSNIVAKDVNGAVVDGYSLVGADAESSDDKESIQWTSSSVIGSLTATGAGTGLGNACAGGFTGINTTTVKCTGQSTGNKTGTAIVAAETPTTFSQTMVGGGLQAVSFGVLVSKVQLSKQVVNGFAGDSFRVAASSPGGSVLGSGNTNGGASASTGEVTVLTGANGENFTLAETATSGLLSNYNGAWSCVRNGATDPSLPSGAAGASNSVFVAIGDFVKCTITNTAKAATLALTKNAGAPVDVNGDGLTDAGDTIAYTFIVKNTGELTLNTIAVDDPKLGPVTCPQPSLAPGDSQTCTASNVYTITSADVTAGAVRNTATASGTAPGVTPRIVSPPSSTSTPTTAPTPALSVTKSATPTTLTAAGQTVSYSFAVQNTGNVAVTGLNIADTFTAPAGPGSAITCPTTTLAPNATTTCTSTYVVTPDDISHGRIDNSAVAQGLDPAGRQITSPPSTASVTVNAADLLAVKTQATPAPAVPGAPVSWTVTVTNNGPAAAAAPTMSDAVPTGVTGVTATTSAQGWNCTVTGQDVSCGAASIPVGTSITVTIAGTLAPTFTGDLVNTATVRSSTADPNPGNNSSTSTTPTVPSADLSIIKSLADPSPAVPGESLVWTLTVTNAGPSAAAAPTVTDAVPGAVTGVTATPTTSGWNCQVSGQNVTCGAANIAPGATAVVTVSGTLAASFTGTLANTARVSSPTPDPNSANNTSTSNTPTAASADLQAVKTQATPNPAVPGESLAWTVTVTNNGPSDAESPTLTDDVPPAVTGVTATTTATGWTCAVNGSSVRCSAASIAPGTSITITVGGTLLDPSYTGAISNTARVSSTTPDPTPGNNTSTSTTPTQPSADLAITKSQASPNPVAAGAAVSWTLVLVNQGPSTAVALSISDVVPAAVGQVSAATSAAGWTCPVSGQNVTCTGSALLPGQTVTVTVSGTLGASFTGVLDNTATTTSSTPDPDVANNTSTSSTPTTASADLQITKKGTPSPAVPGTPITWTVTVTNLGPSDAVNPAMADSVPTAVSGVTASTTTPGWNCTTAVQEVRCSAASLAAGGAAVITITGNLAPSFAGDLPNTATIAAQTPDPNPANNTTTAVLSTVASADLAITKTQATPDPVVPGRALSWTLTVTNDGPSDAQSPSVADSVPAAVTGVDATSTTPGWSCSVSGQDIACLATTLPRNATATITVTGALSTAFTGELANSATTTSSTPDPNTTNNTASVSTPSAPSADLMVVKTQATPNPAIPGQPVSWTVTTTNNGPSTAVSPTMTDDVPSVVTGVTATTAAAGWGCAVTGQRVSCTAATLESGSSITVTIAGTLLDPSFTGPLSNTASLTSNTPDPDPSNNTSTSTTPTAAEADLSITKSLATPNPVVAGQQLSWTLTVVNNGPSTALAPVVTDTVPAAVEGVTAVSADPDWSCVVTAQDVSCTAPRLLPGLSTTIAVRGTLVASFAGDLTNTAKVNSPTTDPDPTNNTSISTTPSTTVADVAIVKSPATPNAVVPGRPLSWTLTVTNNGPSDAAGVTVTDTVPSAVSGVAATGDGWTCAVTGHEVACQAPSQGVGVTTTITVSGTLGADFTGDLVNTAAVTTTSTDPVPGNNTSTSTTPSAPSADLVTVKSLASPNPVVPGGPVSWSVTITNNGPSVAAAPSMADSVPSSVQGVTASATADWTCTVTGQDVACGAPSLAAGATETITVSGTLDATFTGPLENSATTTSSTPDPDPVNNTSTTTTPTAPSADLAITKSLATPNPVVAGGAVAWTLTVINNGPSTAVSPLVTDAVPVTVSGATASTSAAGWSCASEAQSVSCAAAQLPTGTKVTIIVRGTLANPYIGELRNTAAVTSATPDPTPDNNTSTSSTPTTPAPTVPGAPPGGGPPAGGPPAGGTPLGGTPSGGSPLSGATSAVTPGGGAVAVGSRSIVTPRLAYTGTALLLPLLGTSGVLLLLGTTALLVSRRREEDS